MEKGISLGGCTLYYSKRGSSAAEPTKEHGSKRLSRFFNVVYIRFSCIETDPSLLNYHVPGQYIAVMAVARARLEVPGKDIELYRVRC